MSSGVVHRAARILLLALLSSALGAEEASQGSDPAPVAAEEDPFAIESIVVTGTRTRSKGGPSIAPVVTFTGEELIQRGFTTLGDFSRSLTLNAGAVSEYTSFTGSASFNLRGLGTDATLTLLNGRRVAIQQGFGNPRSIDLNMIPITLIDRIEILKDGASAIYGADAIAGAVNIILRQSFLGGQLDVHYRNTEQSDVSELQLAGSFGAYIGTGSVWGFASYYDSNALFGRDVDTLRTVDLRDERGPAADMRLFGGQPGNYFIIRPDETIDFSWDPACAETGGPVGVYDPTTQPGVPLSQILTLADNFLSEQACRYDDAPVTTVLRASERATVFAGLDFEVGEADLFGEFLYNKRDTRNRFGHSPLRVSTGPRVFNLPVVGADHPGNPFADPVALFAHAMDAGLRTGSNDWTFFRALAGLRGTVGAWDYEVAAYGSRDELDRRLGNRILESELLAALDGRGGPNGDQYYDPFGGAVNPPEVIDAFLVDASVFLDNETAGIEAFAARELFAWRHGAASLAAGVEYREFSDRITAPEQRTIIQLPTAPELTFEREVASVFAELTVPIYRDFDVQLAARFEDFSDFGSQTSPKIALRWQANEHLILRGSYSEAFRAPDSFELIPDSQIGAASYVDPVRCADPVLGQRPECQFNVVPATFTGNPELAPEEGQSVVLGFLFTPPGLTDLAVDVDLWRFEYKDRIDSLTPGAVALFFPDDPRFVLREPPTEEDLSAGRPGRVSELILPFINFERLETSGADIAVTYETEFRKLGRLEMDARASYLSDYEFTDSLALSPGDRAGSGSPFPLPRWRANFGAVWTLDEHSVALNANRIHRYVSPSFSPFGAPDYEQRVHWTFDVQYRLQLPRWNRATLRVGCIDCFDRGVPRDADGYGALAGFYDPRGRQFAVSYTQPF